MDYFKHLFTALLSQQQKSANAIAISKHLARVQLYELKGVNALYPDVREKCVALIEKMSSLKMPITVTTIRTAKSQDDLYAQGRTTTGSIVTNAKGLQSFHNFGLAFDCVFVEGGYNAPTSWWDTLGKEGKKLGLEWGGDWTSFPDRPHFEWHPNFDWKELEAYLK